MNPCAAGTLGLAIFVLAAGCNSDSGYQPIPKGTKPVEAPHEHEHGPHGGHLVELGQEDYHAEVVFDAKKAAITVYLLDSSAKKPSPTEAKQVVLTLTLDGKPHKLPAPAAPQPGDPEGKSSRFELAGNADVKSHVKDEEDLKGTVEATIGGRSFTGPIVHEH